MRVLFVTSGDETTASSRLRVFNLRPSLSRVGIHSGVVSWGPEALVGPDPLRRALFFTYLLLRALRADVLYVQKVLVHPGLVTVLQRLGTKVIFDLDDATYAPRPWSGAPDDQVVRRIQRLFGAVDLVVAGSSAIGAYARQYADETAVLPVALQRELYESHRRISGQGDRNQTTRIESREADASAGFSRPTDGSTRARDGASPDPDGTESVTIVWIGNPSNLRYLATREEALAHTLDDHPEAVLRIITAGEMPVQPFRDRDDVEYRTWSLETQLEDLATADIGVRPLTDDEWTRSKGGFVSVLQPMALGLPVVVTPVGMLEDIVDHGVNGFHATAPSEWVEHIGTLIEDTETRVEMGRRAVETLSEERFWADQRAEDLRAVLEAVVE